MSVPWPAPARSDSDLLRVIVVAAGIGWAGLFVVIGLRYELQLYGDGAMFSYSVAVQDVWAFHWHNISGRAAVYFLCLAPAETYVALTGDPVGGIAVYGTLFFAMPLAGLYATYMADRSPDRAIFNFACASTALLNPLVFGFPTEMWLAHAWFWPVLALAHYAPRGVAGLALVFITLLVLVFTHEGAFVLAFVIVATLAVRGVHDAAFVRAIGALAAAMVIWVAVKIIFPPGPYFAGVYIRAALGFFDVSLLHDQLLMLLLATTIAYAIAWFALARLAPARAPILAAILVAAALALYWLSYDDALHASERYYMRTLLVIATPMFGIPAALFALNADSRLLLAAPLLTRVRKALRCLPARALAGLFVLLTIVHAVETVKFVNAWTHYKAAVRQLAIGTASDPALGDPRFVSSDRIGGGINRLAWFSTTHYLSIILAQFAPSRLVVDPSSNYFWLSCATATANLDAERAIPQETRALIVTYACLHR